MLYFKTTMCGLMLHLLFYKQNYIHICLFFRYVYIYIRLTAHTIYLAKGPAQYRSGPDRDTITPFEIVRDVEVLCGKIKYATDFLVLGSPQDDFSSLYLVDLS